VTEASVRPPKQKRSRESLERVLDASIQLLEDDGFDAFTIQDLSQRAGVSVGAIYARFGNKESLLREVHRHAMALLGAQQEAIGPGGSSDDVGEAIVAAVRSVATVFRGNERLLRAFMHLGAADEEISRRGSAVSTELSRRFAASVLAHRAEIAHRDPETAVGWDGLVDEVGAACAAYLLAGGSRPVV
jgi:AcrR family transcriptional regulator